MILVLLHDDVVISQFDYFPEPVKRSRAGNMACFTVITQDTTIGLNDDSIYTIYDDIVRCSMRFSEVVTTILLT